MYAVVCFVNIDMVWDRTLGTGVTSTYMYVGQGDKKTHFSAMGVTWQVQNRQQASAGEQLFLPFIQQQNKQQTPG